MEIALLKLIYQYSSKRKLVDNNYIDKLIDIIVTQKQLNKYIYKLEILPYGEYREIGRLLANYNPNSKTLRVFNNCITDMLKEKDKYRILFTDIEQMFYNNLLITQIILHELEHINQRKIIDSEDGIEAGILKASMLRIDLEKVNELLKLGCNKEEILVRFQEDIRRKRQNYKENYYYAPEERLAEIKSYEEIIKVISEIKEFIPNLLDFENTNLLENMLRGYECQEYQEGIIMPPTFHYLLQSGQSLQQFEWFDSEYSKCLEFTKEKYKLKDRMKFGLLIDEDEFDYIAQTIQKSKKYNC